MVTAALGVSLWTLHAMAVTVWDMLEWVHMGTLGPAQRVVPQMPLTQPAVAQGLLRSDGNTDVSDMFSF